MQILIRILLALSLIGVSPVLADQSSIHIPESSSEAKTRSGLATSSFDDVVRLFLNPALKTITSNFLGTSCTAISIPQNGQWCFDTGSRTVKLYSPNGSGIYAWNTAFIVNADGSLSPSNLVAGAVSSVAGRSGSVVLTSADLTDSTAFGRSIVGAASAAAAKALLSIAAGSSGQFQTNSSGSLAGVTISGDFTINGTTGVGAIGANAITASKIAAGAAVANIGYPPAAAGANTDITSLSSGNIGIGVASATLAKLQIKAASLTALSLTTSDFVQSATGSVLNLEFGATTGNTYAQLSALSAGASAWNNLILQVGGGNVGIGTAAPAYKLDVAGGVKASVETLTAGQTLSIAPTGNTATTLSSLAVQGNTASTTTREFLATFGLTQNDGTAATNRSGTGDKVTLYAGIDCVTSGGGGCWPLNVLTRIESGYGASGAYGASASEVDMDNLDQHSGEPDGLAGLLSTPHYAAVGITGASSFRAAVALEIDGPGAPIWNRGIAIRGNSVAQSSFQDLGVAHTSIDIRGSHSNAGIDMSTMAGGAAIVIPNANAYFFVAANGTDRLQAMFSGPDNRVGIGGPGSAGVYWYNSLSPANDNSQNFGSPTSRIANVYSGAVQSLAYYASNNGTNAGVSCSGAPTGSFASVNGIVTHC